MLLSAKQISFNYEQVDQNIHSYHIIINFSNVEDSLRLALSRRGGISALKSLQYIRRERKNILQQQGAAILFQSFRIQLHQKAQNLKQILKQHIHAEYYSESALPLCYCSHGSCWVRLHWNSSKVIPVPPVTSSPETHECPSCICVQMKESRYSTFMY